MKKRKLEVFKSKLIQEKNSVLETINLIDENSGLKQEFSTELSLYDNHPADIATELFMEGQNINLKNNGKNMLYKIENALEKINSSGYGVCDKCGKKINFDRLSVLPYASNCIECENKKSIDNFIEQGTNKHYTFGRTFKDDSESEPVNFDGEDSWQSVNDYNVVPKDPSYGTGDYIGLVDEDEIGVVEDVEKISYEYYRKQL